MLDEAIAQNHVNKHALDENGNLITDINSSNMDKILAGKDAYDKLTDAQKKLVDDMISQQSDGKYSNYGEYIQAAKDAVNASAQSFISKYLTGSDGKIFTTATEDNYAQILSGKDAWNALSQAEKDAINAQLVANGGKTYEELLELVQEVKDELEAEAEEGDDDDDGSVKTGDHSPILPLTLALFLSAGVIAFEVKKRRF